MLQSPCQTLALPEDNMMLRNIMLPNPGNTFEKARNRSCRAPDHASHFGCFEPPRSAHNLAHGCCELLSSGTAQCERQRLCSVTAYEFGSHLDHRHLELPDSSSQLWVAIGHLHICHLLVVHSGVGGHIWVAALQQAERHADLKGCPMRFSSRKAGGSYYEVQISK